MAKVQKITGVRGMNDILPSESYIWEVFEQAAHDVLAGYGYKQIRTPILESTPLFKRGIGEVTDIVEKEMYCFTDSLNGEPLALRPENTAGVVRSVIEHNLCYNAPQRTLARCSVMNVPNEVAIVNSINWVLKHLALRDRMSTLNKF